MTTTYMDLTEPTPGVGGTPGPLWAQQLNTNFDHIDKHDHTGAPNGIRLGSAAFNIDGDIPFNTNNAIGLRTVRFTDGAASVFGTNDKSILFSKSGELHWRDQSGNDVPITSSGSVKSSIGQIIDLSLSGELDFIQWAKASNNLIFQSSSADGTMMNLVAGGLVLTPPGAGGSSAQKVTIEAPAVPTAPGYTITLPVAPPATTQIMSMTSAGVISVADSAPGALPLGSVIATFPNLVAFNAYVCSTTTAADSRGFVKCNGDVISDATSPMNGATLPNINNDVFLKGNITAGTPGGGTATLSTANVPSHTHSVTSTGGSHLHGGNTGGPSGVSHNHVTSSYSGGSGIYPNGIAQASPTGLSLPTGDVNAGSPGLSTHTHTISSSGTLSVSGTTDEGSGSGTAFSVTPKFISAIFVMRIK